MFWRKVRFVSCPASLDIKIALQSINQPACKGDTPGVALQISHAIIGSLRTFVCQKKKTQEKTESLGHS